MKIFLVEQNKHNYENVTAKKVEKVDKRMYFDSKKEIEILVVCDQGIVMGNSVDQNVTLLVREMIRKLTDDFIDKKIVISENYLNIQKKHNNKVEIV